MNDFNESWFSGGRHGCRPYINTLNCKDVIYRVHILAMLFTLLILSACTATSPEPELQPPSLGQFPTLEAVDLPLSAWGNVELIAQAENRDAPVFFPIENEEIIFSWTGSQQDEARIFSRGMMGNSQIMPLKAFFPFQQALFANPEGVLMLWLDRTAETQDIRLQMGLFNHEGITTLGPGNISSLRTRNYSAALMDNGDLNVIWSGGIGSVMNLYFQRIDSRLRTLGSNDLRVDADYPALVKDGEDLYLFWLEDNGRAVYSGRIENETLSDVQRIARTNIAGTVAIDYFTASSDGETIYLFWNLRQLDGSRQVLFSSGSIGDTDFSRPIPFGISVSDEQNFETIYAIDNVPAAQLSEANQVAWAVPASPTAEMLPVVVNLGKTLGVAFFRDGQLVAYQAVVESGALIGLPHIQILNDNHLAISWSQASNRAYANLFFSSSRTSP